MDDDDDDRSGGWRTLHIEIGGWAGEQWPRLHNNHSRTCNIDLGRGRSLTQKPPFERVCLDARAQSGFAGARGVTSACSEMVARARSGRALA